MPYPAPRSPSAPPRRRPLLLLLLPGLVAAAEDGLPQVMSTNLCADLLLLAVAAPE
jgi:hypothetical protein